MLVYTRLLLLTSTGRLSLVLNKPWGGDLKALLPRPLDPCSELPGSDRQDHKCCCVSASGSIPVFMKLAQTWSVPPQMTVRTEQALKLPAPGAHVAMSHIFCGPARLSSLNGQITKTCALKILCSLSTAVVLYKRSELTNKGSFLPIKLLKWLDQVRASSKRWNKVRKFCQPQDVRMSKQPGKYYCKNNTCCLS